LKAAERCYELIASMSGCLRDPRQAGKVDRSLRDLFAQRVFSIGCGYADANDSARLAADPTRKMLLDRDPVMGLDMASQPTLSRVENAVGPRKLYSMGAALTESVIDRHAKRLHHRARLGTIDLDPTDDPTHDAPDRGFASGSRITR
jgi:Transposase DDE domain group 1